MDWTYRHATTPRRRVHNRLYIVPVAPDGTVDYGPAAGWGDHLRWGGMPKTLWPAVSSFAWPLLVRGERLDAPGDLRFNGPGGPLLGDLRTVVSAARHSGALQEIGWWYLRFNAPGCYGLQFDWPAGSEVIVFRARG